MSGILMKCGHRAHGKDNKGNPVCVICYGIRDGATEIEDTLPDLTGRQARCACGRIKESSVNLPFFEYRPDYTYDSFYCGHGGWD